MRFPTGLPRFARNTLLLLLLVLVGDRAVGWWLEKSFYRQKHGDDLVSIYALEQAREDILVLGGSRASHHYVAADIERYTGAGCFNGGRDNMDILYEAAAVNIIIKRYTPKVLLLDMTFYDLADYGEGRRTNIQRTSTALLPFANRHPELYPTISLAGPLERWKARMIRTYPYNSLVGSILQNTYTSLGHQSIKGYEPLYRRIDTATYTQPQWGNKLADDPLDTVCVARLADVISTATRNHIRLITVISPFYFPMDFEHHKSYVTLKRMVTEAGFECYDFSHSAPFLKNPALFDDDVHLNDSGAKLYTRQIADIIRQRR